jgi:3-methyl-2-oxobutanoate hydroxymethyltransferase
MITVYDYPTACIFDICGFDYFLVGDSVGMVELGLPDTRSVTMDMLAHHLRAVKRGTEQTHIIADMPINTYSDEETGLRNSSFFLEAGADSVKLEGPCYDVVRRLVAEGIEVIGHIGLTPQTAANFKMKGTTSEEVERLKQEAAGLEEAGCYGIILEHIPASVGQEITEYINIPTIGIGAGPYTTGQVLVSSDLLGLFEKVPPFAKKYADLKTVMEQAARAFIQEVDEGAFPSEEYYRE